MRNLVGTASLVGLRIHALRQAAFYIDSETVKS